MIILILRQRPRRLRRVERILEQIPRGLVGPVGDQRILDFPQGIQHRPAVTQRRLLLLGPREREICRKLSPGKDR